MKKIFEQLARHWRACIIVFLLLLLQAHCDLTLPGYTSNIVDVGITQGGVESPVAKEIREDTLAVVELFMSAEDAEALDAAYGEADEQGVRYLEEKDKDRLAALEDTSALPEMLLYMAASQQANGADLHQMMMSGMQDSSMMSVSSNEEVRTPKGEDLDAVVDMMKSLPAMMGGLPEEQAKEMLRARFTQGLEELKNSLDETTLATLQSRSVQFVALEYDSLGIAMEIQTGYLLRVGGQMLAFTLLMVLVSVLVGFVASRTGASIGRDLRAQVFTKVIGFSAAETDRFSTASLITRSTNDVQQVQMVCVILMRMVFYAPILAVGGIVRVAGTGVSLTWIIVTAVCVLIGVIMILLLVAMPKFQVMQTLVDKLNLVSREILTGIMPVRAFSREDFEEKRFDKANKDLMQTQLFTNRVMALMFPAMMLVMNGVSLAIVWFGGKQISYGNMQAGEMIAYITYSMQIVSSFLMITMVAVFLPRAGVAAKRIEEVLKSESSVADPAEPVCAICPAAVEFDHVHFRFPGGTEDALTDITFTAECGKTTAIIGATGSGKSTLLNLIPRFYDVTEGAVRVAGCDVRDMTQEYLRDMIGYVPQKGVLFSGTIASNLKFADPEISDEQMKKAAAIAQAADFIEEKGGYDSEIAQGGSNVSGGQKQRLSIGRAVAKNPKIYLFDDSFSALDYKTDLALRTALGKETQDAAVIIVAQRISTVLHADQILVLEDGHLMGKGTHEELMKNCETYQEIARSQLSEKELAGKGGEH